MVLHSPQPAGSTKRTLKSSFDCTIDCALTSLNKLMFKYIEVRLNYIYHLKINDFILISGLPYSGKEHIPKVNPSIPATIFA